MFQTLKNYLNRLLPQTNLRDAMYPIAVFFTLVHIATLSYEARNGVGLPEWLSLRSLMYLAVLFIFGEDQEERRSRGQQDRFVLPVGAFLAVWCVFYLLVRTAIVISPNAFTMPEDLPHTCLYAAAVVFAMQVERGIYAYYRYRGWSPSGQPRIQTQA